MCTQTWWNLINYIRRCNHNAWQAVHTLHLPAPYHLPKRAITKLLVSNRLSPCYWITAAIHCFIPHRYLPSSRFPALTVTLRYDCKYLISTLDFFFSRLATLQLLQQFYNADGNFRLSFRVCFPLTFSKIWRVNFDAVCFVACSRFEESGVMKWFSSNWDISCRKSSVSQARVKTA